MKKCGAKLISLLLLSSMLLSGLSGCGAKKDVEVMEGGKLITFQYIANSYTSDTFTELIDTYNNTQGKEDKVVVSGIKKTSDYSDSCNTILTSNAAPNVIVISDKFFKKYAEQDRFVCLQDYLDGYDLSDVSETMLTRFSYDKSTEPSSAGKGQPIYGLPLGSNPSIIFYNIDYFEQQGIHIISVLEEDLDAYNKEHGTNYKPHGYAEYLNAPEEGLKTSKNLDGETVYKVFNNQIPMSWDEMVYVSKIFTKNYNPSSPTEYGYLTEWWFSYGWSVGGDCIGWNESKGEYEFTLGDDTPNYLVTADMTFNGTEYKAGDLLYYGDKISLNGELSSLPAADRDKLYQLPSQLDAFIRYNSLTQDKYYEVMKGEKGLDVGHRSLSDKLKAFTSGSIAMLNDYFSMYKNITAASEVNWDLAPMQQYRCYDGDLDNDGVVKVIGKDGYTGDLLVKNGTEVKGKLITQSLDYAMFITEASDSSEYEAAAKFIKWVASEEGQKIYMDSNKIAIRTELYDSAETINDVLDKKNIGAAVLLSKHTELGDWSYFDNGTWISSWSTPLNDDVRNRRMTLAKFFKEIQDVANKDLAEKDTRTYGRLADQ